jgi:ribosomal protein S18 acetylase RimI-like enzyme
MEIIDYMPKYAHEIADLFHDSVHEIGRNYYTKKEIEAWAPTPPDYEKWSARLNKKKPYIAVQNSKVVGFIELESNGHIDCLYTHKDFQRCGVARNLYLHLEKEAISKGIKRLYVEASHPAKPFFEKQNFKLVKENTVERNGVKLTNFTMEKGIAP